MKPRHRAREIALQILYQYDVTAHSIGTPIPEGQDLVRDLVHHFEHFHVESNLRTFASQLVTGSLNHIKKLDALLSKHVSNWKVTRLGFVDRSLLRMATYELLNFPETAPSIVIDEAIELAKEFGTEDSPAFINGVLDAIRKEKTDLKD